MPTHKPSSSDGRHRPEGRCLHCVAVSVSNKEKTLPICLRAYMRREIKICRVGSYWSTSTLYVLDKNIYQRCIDDARLLLSHGVREGQLNDNLLCGSLSGRRCWALSSIMVVREGQLDEHLGLHVG